MKATQSLLMTLVLCWLTASTCQAFYNPEQGRWLNRDPVDERGGKNLTALLRNDPVNSWDVLGLHARTQPRALPCYCCECAEAITIYNPQWRHPPLSPTLVGHSFNVKIVLTYRKVRIPLPPRSPKLKWEENSDRPPKRVMDRGARPNEWYDVFEIDPGSDSEWQWKYRDKDCEERIRAFVTVDFPAVSESLGNRVLRFRLSVVNPPECNCPEPMVTATAKQVIDFSRSPPGEFFIPDPIE